jgi:hypothetical protein
MARRKIKPTRAAVNLSPRERERRDQQSAAVTARGRSQRERAWVTGPTLRELLN